MLRAKREPRAVCRAETSNQPAPMLPSVYSALMQFLAGGYTGPKVSYFA